MSENKTDTKAYTTPAWIIGIITFISIWIYALSEWGLLIGLVIGWLPAIIGAVIIGFLWPIILFIILIGLLFGLLSGEW